MAMLQQLAASTLLADSAFAPTKRGSVQEALGCLRKDSRFLCCLIKAVGRFFMDLSTIRTAPDLAAVNLHSGGLKFCLKEFKLRHYTESGLLV
jgi:hypothetical protein